MTFGRDLKISNILNWLAVAVAAIAHLQVGGLCSSTGKILARLYTDMEDAELPTISAALLPYMSSGLPLVVGGVLAVISGGSLGFLNRKDRFRPILPFAVAVSMVAAILHLAACWFAATLPLLKGPLQVGP